MRRLKPILVLAVFAISAQANAADCLSNLPNSVRSTLEQDSWKILSPFDLPTDDWKLWKNTHQGQCPGVAVGNFFPKAESSYAVALIQQDDQKKFLEQVVIVTQRKGQTATQVVVPPTQVTSPYTLWKLPPGHYAGVDGTKAGISRDSFVYEKIASTAKQFYYQGSNLKSFVISF